MSRLLNMIKKKLLQEAGKKDEEGKNVLSYPPI